MSDGTRRFAAAGKCFLQQKPALLGGWEQPGSPRSDPPVKHCLGLRENPALQAQARGAADVETCGIFPLGMSSQNGGGRRSPSQLVSVLAGILSSALQRLSEGLARRAVSWGVFCVTSSDKARCWMRRAVPLPPPASLAALPGLCEWHLRSSGCAGAAAVELFVPDPHRYSACCDFCGFRYSV